MAVCNLLEALAETHLVLLSICVRGPCLHCRHPASDHAQSPSYPSRERCIDADHDGVTLSLDLLAAHKFQGAAICCEPSKVVRLTSSAFDGNPCDIPQCTASSSFTLRVVAIDVLVIAVNAHQSASPWGEEL